MSKRRYEYKVREVPVGFMFGLIAGEVQDHLDAGSSTGWRLASTISVGRSGNPVLLIWERPVPPETSEDCGTGEAAA